MRLLIYIDHSTVSLPRSRPLADADLMQVRNQGNSISLPVGACSISTSTGSLTIPADIGLNSCQEL